LCLLPHPIRLPCRSGLEIRLQCRTADQKCTASRGRPQKKALLRLKINPPPKLARGVDPPLKEDGEDDYLSDADISVGASSLSTLRSPLRLSCSIADSSCSSSAESEPIDFGDPPNPIPHLHQNLRRRRVRGYIINSEEESYSSGSETHRLRDNNFSRLLDDDTCVNDEDEHHDKEDPSSTSLLYHPGSGEIIAITPANGEGWTAYSDLPLPLYTEKITVPLNLTKPEKILASMTMYGELSSAETADHFAPIFRRLQQEWTFIGGLVCLFSFFLNLTQLKSIPARRSCCVGDLLVIKLELTPSNSVNTAVFSISPDSIFKVDSYARSAVATSSVASGLGIACDAWFLLRYNWADIHTFIVCSLSTSSPSFFHIFSSPYSP